MAAMVHGPVGTTRSSACRGVLHRAGPLQKRHPTDLGLADQLAFDELEAVSEGEEIAAFQEFVLKL